MKRDHAELEERTTRFGEDVIKLAKSIPVTAITKRLIDQAIGASSSVGANYCEANESETRKAFRYRIATCRKEAKESRHFLRLLATAHEPCRDEARRLYREATELTRIFASIHRNSEPKA